MTALRAVVGLAATLLPEDERKVTAKAIAENKPLEIFMFSGDNSIIWIRKNGKAASGA